MNENINGGVYKEEKFFFGTITPHHHQNSKLKN